jgi:group I intron endonuclease
MHTCNINGKRYVGQTSKTWEERWRAHCWEAEKRPHLHFHRAIVAYGKDAWQHDVLATVESEDEALELEQRFILEYRTFEPELGYNMTMGGEGFRATDESRKRLSRALTGNEKLRNALRGRKLSEEHKRKISEARKGMKFSDEHKRKISESKTGVVHSEETKAKMSEAHKGKIFSNEHRANISKSRRGQR